MSIRILACCLLAVCVGIGSSTVSVMSTHESLIQSIGHSITHGLVSHRRIVRQSGFGSTRSLVCVRECVRDSFTENGVNLTVESQVEDGVDSDYSIALDFVDMFKDNQSLRNMCTGYKRSKQCESFCEDTMTKLEVKQYPVTLEHICVEHYNEYMDVAPCLEKTHTGGVQDSCKAQCGGADYTEQQLAKLRQDDEESDSFMRLLKMVSTVDSVCKFEMCTAECASTKMDQICGYSGASDLQNALLSKQWKEQQVDLWQAAGIDFLFPSSCSKIVDAKFGSRTVEVTSE